MYIHIQKHTCMHIEFCFFDLCEKNVQNHTIVVVFVWEDGGVKIKKNSTYIDRGTLSPHSSVIKCIPCIVFGAFYFGIWKIKKDFKGHLGKKFMQK